HYGKHSPLHTTHTHTMVHTALYTPHIHTLHTTHTHHTYTHIFPSSVSHDSSHVVMRRCSLVPSVWKNTHLNVNVSVCCGACSSAVMTVPLKSVLLCAGTKSFAFSHCLLSSRSEERRGGKE